ncbi:MAG: DEAD/DEAH box helicase family protein [Candidatus Hadarchaeales archaeon]
MPRRTRAAEPQRNVDNGSQQYIKLENHLILLAWLNNVLGYQSNRELLEDCKGVAEGFGPDGSSFLYHHLIARGDKVKLRAEKLAQYDENIRQHLEKINCGRTEKITLRYFQYLAALYTEIILDRFFNDKGNLLADLNAFVIKRNANRSSVEPKGEPFTEDDLTKLAFWMATGSGKTLLLHLNYYQFLHYNREPLDNILLITPREDLSEQHLVELTTSGIPAQRFELNSGSLWTKSKGVVQVIEITKLVEEKRGGGVSVPLEAFEGRNLIFVDEGHKGSGGEAWRKYRNALGANGFTFEYSATFGQALSALGDDELTKEYGKCIAFDYSYKYFYNDGFGKDFRILNLRNEVDDEKRDILLLGNLLSFYEQMRLYQEEKDTLRPYNLEKPLWVFVGHTVKGKSSDDQATSSDVFAVVRFLHRVLSDRAWTVEKLKAILEGKSGLLVAHQIDAFADRFPFLKKNGLTPGEIYDDILKHLFHAPGSGGLHLADIKRSPGELGLKAAGAHDYFGVIYIGDVSAFKKLVEKTPTGITLEEDVISTSLFEYINRPDSGIHVLIGAKKFMEGWNSWRVSSMGLLNIGKEEGAQIIQLFGRGVRLKGKDMSLKRSAALEGMHPPYIRLLETLNIFAVRANYMGQFRNYLEREGVEVESLVEIPIPVKINKGFSNRKLWIPRPPNGANFVNVPLILEPDESITVRLDLSARLQVIESNSQAKSVPKRVPDAWQAIPSGSLEWVDWQQVYLDVLAYKVKKEMQNLVIQPTVLRSIIELRDKQGVPLCQLIADERVFSPRSFAHRALLQEAVTRLLFAYIDRFYQVRRRQWEEANLVYQELNENDPNLSFGKHEGARAEAAYMVRVPVSEEKLIKAIEELIKQERLYTQTDNELPRINFDRHIYVPLLLEKASIHVSPPALNAGERRFVDDLRKYWDDEKDKSLVGKEIFLLRNLSRGVGVSFFEERGFYPDFILWVIDQKSGTQRVVFVEPHGMLHAKAYAHDEKARLHERLPQLAQAISKRSQTSPVVSLDSFIISATPYEDLRKFYDDGTWDRVKFAEKHILFPERGSDYDYIKILLWQ